MDKTGNNFSTNTRSGIDNTKSLNIDNEVTEIIKKDGDKASMNDLIKKYGDDKIFDMVQGAYYEKLSSIRKRAIKFTKLIERKYGISKMSKKIVFEAIYRVTAWGLSAKFRRKRPS